jgi:F-type H+-transporting ATPase subunit gamma
MSDSSAALRASMATATDLQSMARTMKTIAASNIGQYEAAVRSLDAYYGVVQDSLSACLRASRGAADSFSAGGVDGPAGAIVFGSDQGLVGQFNEAICASMLAGTDAPQRFDEVWPVGERIAAALADRGVANLRAFALPASIDAVTVLVARLLVEIEAYSAKNGLHEIYVFHHRPAGASGYQAVCQRLLPLDRDWERDLVARPRASNAVTQVLPAGEATLRACIGEYLFVSLFRACAESLASENAARLSAMQRAEKNIGERLQLLTQTFHRQRQGAIDEELFDLVAGFEAQQAASTRRKRENTQN